MDRPRARLLALVTSWVGATRALSGCAGGLDEPAPSVIQEPLGQPPWSLSDVGDFDGDGLGDILWDHPGKSEMTVWLTKAPDVFAPGPILPGPPGAAWDAVWTADFNADGLSDVRWYNADNLKTSLWLMNGNTLLSAGPIFPGPLGPGWERSSCADFDADGMADMLWRNTLTGFAKVFLIHGTLPAAQATLAPPPGPGWLARIAADFDADGMADVLWINPPSQRVAVGLMNGTKQVLLGPPIPMPPGDGWSVVTAPDLDGDGQSDLLWTSSTTHAVTTWLMSGTARLVAGPELPAPPGAGWEPVNSSDIDGDGSSDILWENTTTHRFLIWYMAGTAVLRAGPEIPTPDGP